MVVLNRAQKQLLFDLAVIAYGDTNLVYRALCLAPREWHSYGPWWRRKKNWRLSNAPTLLSIIGYIKENRQFFDMCDRTSEEAALLLSLEANRALKALKKREGEDIEEWAENLAQSAVLQGD